VCNLTNFQLEFLEEGSDSSFHHSEFRYEGESIIICSAVAFVLAALSFLCISLGVVSFLSLLHGFEVARSVPLSQP